MFNWYSKSADADWADEFQRFSAAYSAFGKPPEMMLIADRQIRILYARLNPGVLDTLPGYKTVADLPKDITFLVGDVRTYKLLFGCILHRH